MQPLAIVNDLRIASPCPASWDTMQGDDRTRFCETCSKNVYNVSDLTSTEITDLIQKAEGRLCIRLYRRKDGTVLTADCPVGFRYSVRRRLVRLLTIGVILAATIRAGAWCSMRRSELTELPPAHRPRCHLLRLGRLGDRGSGHEKAGDSACDPTEILSRQAGNEATRRDDECGGLLGRSGVRLSYREIRYRKMNCSENDIYVR